MPYTLLIKLAAKIQAINPADFITADNIQTVIDILKEVIKP